MREWLPVKVCGPHLLSLLFLNICLAVMAILNFRVLNYMGMYYLVLICFWWFCNAFFKKTISRDMYNVIIYDIKGVKMGESKKINLFCEVFIFMSYWWAIKILLFISKGGLKGAQISNISHIWKVYRIFIFHSILMCCFVVEWIVLRAFNNVSTEFLCLLWFTKFEEKIVFPSSFNAVFASVYLNVLLMVHNKKCYLILTRGLKGAHIPNGLCWVRTVVCRPIFSINSHFYCSPTVMYVCGGGHREFASQCVLDTSVCDKDCQWLVVSQWFFLGILVSSTSKTDHHDITDILLNVVFTTVTLYPTCYDLQLKIYVKMYITIFL